MAILKVQPNAVDTTGNFAVGAVTTTGNVTVGGRLIVNNTILPTTANVIDIGSPTMRFGALYLAGNTIDLGGTLITTSGTGDLKFTTQSGNIAITANTISFLSTVANTASEEGNVAFDGNVNAYAIYTDNYFYANGAVFTSGAGSVGYTGSRGTQGIQGTTGGAGSLGYTGSVGAGYTGSKGDPGNTGTSGYTGSAGTFSGSTSSLIVTSNTTSTGTSTGALQVSGGAGITGNVYAGAVYTGGLYWSSNGSVISTGGGSASGGYLNMVMTGAVIPPVVGVARLYPPVDMTVTTIYANLSSAPSNGNMTFVIKKNGTSTGTTFTLSTALMAPVTVSIVLTMADYLTIDVAGSSSADLRVTLKYI